METSDLIIIAFLVFQTLGSAYMISSRRRTRQRNARLRANLKTYCERTEV